MRKEFYEITVATIIVLSVAYVSYKRGRNDAFIEFRDVVNEVNNLGEKLDCNK